MQKIFCVGFSKTGTFSLNKALLILGYKSVHTMEIQNTINKNTRRKCRLLEGYESPDAYTDFVFTYFRRLDKDYPNSTFICTYRDPTEIAFSAIRHSISKNFPFFSSYKRNFFRAVKHFDNVFSYFNGGKKKFLIMRICDGDGWGKLCPFLGKEVPQQSFPWENQNDL